MADNHMGPQDVISDLRRGYGELTQSQKRIAEAIVEDPEFVAFATVDKMAARLGVSPSTVVRFAYRIGLNGYQELQDRVRQLVRAQMRSNVPADEGARSLTTHLGDSVFTQSFEHDMEILQRTIVGLNVEDLTRAVSALTAARRIHVVGAATSNSVAYYAWLTLDRMRGEAYLLGGDATAGPALLSVTDADALLVYTFPPYASSSLRATTHAKAQGATVVAITDTPISPVGQRVDIVLPTLSSGVSAQNSYVAAMAVTNALLNGVFASSPMALQRYNRLSSMLDSWDLYVLKGDDAG
jgi:DNA-binding MurR/RpiR family transcriptional regulator